jgi:hypothetical protein
MRHSGVSHGFFLTRTGDCQPKQKLQEAKVDFPPSELRGGYATSRQVPRGLSMTHDNVRDP